MSGAMYLNHRGAAELCRMAHRMAVEDKCHHQAPVFAAQAAHHEAEAALIRSRLAAARKLGLRGTAGAVPAGYFADAPCAATAPQGTALS